MKRILLLAAFAVSFLCQISAQSQVYELKSPDGRVSFSFTGVIGTDLRYSISVDGNVVINWSRMGITHSDDNFFDIATIMP